MGLVLDEQKSEDTLYNINDLEVLVENDLATKFDGFEVDYSNNWLRKGFVVQPVGYGSGHC